MFLATDLFCRDESRWGENIMSKRLLVALLGAAFTCVTLSAQELPLIHQPTLTPQDSGTTNGLIAVWPVNPQVVWASGRNGTFTVTTDGGETWNAGVVPGAEALQFRDVQAFSASVAYLMSIGDNPTDFRVYKTLDGGATWTIQFENQNPSGFYDGFAFWTPQPWNSAWRLNQWSIPRFSHNQRNDMAGHQQQHAAGLAR